jgi:hypothetical protein
VATPKQFRRRGRWVLIIGTLLATLAFVGVALATSFDQNGTYSALGGTNLHQDPPIANTDVTPQCTDAELASLPPGGVLWHFVLTQTTALNNKLLRADFETAGLTDPDVVASAVNGGNPQWNIITPTADTLLNASTDSVGSQLNLSHVCYAAKASPDISTEASGAGSTGDKLYDTAHLTGGSTSPVMDGTVTFRLYNLDDEPTCSTALYTDTVDVTGESDGTADVQSTDNGSPSGGNIATTAASYTWVASYSGDDNNEAAGPNDCGEEAETSVVEASVPDVETELHAPDHGVIANDTALDLGSKVHDSGTVTGPAALGTPDGHVNFVFYSEANCGGEGADAGTIDPLAAGATAGEGVAHPSTEEGALAPGSYGFKAFFVSENTDVWQDSESKCEPFTVNQGQLTADTILHAPDHSVIADGAALDLGSKVHDTAQISGQVDGFTEIGDVTFTYYSSYEECNKGGAPIANDGTEVGGDPKSLEVGPLAPGSYAFQASVAENDFYKGGSSACEPFTVNKGNLSIVTNIHNAAHTVVTEVPVNSTVHDTATISGANSNFAPDTSNVGFVFYTTIDCTGEGTLVANTGVADTVSGDPRSADVGPLASGAYSFRARFAGDANYNAVPGSSVACEPLSVRTFGKTMGFWGNPNGIARIIAAGGYAANAVNIGRGANVDTSAEATKILPNNSNLNACGKGTPFIFTVGAQTATAACKLATGINVNSLNTLAAQTLALGYNIKLVSGFTGQTLGALGCAPVNGLTAASTVDDAFNKAVSLIDGSSTGGATTQSQIGLMNTLLGCINAEA